MFWVIRCMNYREVWYSIRQTTSQLKLTLTLYFHFQAFLQTWSGSLSCFVLSLWFVSPSSAAIWFQAVMYLCYSWFVCVTLQMRGAGACFIYSLTNQFLTRVSLSFYQCGSHKNTLHFTSWGLGPLWSYYYVMHPMCGKGLSMVPKGMHNHQMHP